MRDRKQSTSTYHILLYLVLSIDHLTPATGKTVTVTLSKNATAFGAAAGAVTEISNGWYKLAGNATDTDTLGSLAINATASGCDPFVDEYAVIAADPFDSVRMGMTALPNASAGASGGVPVFDANLSVAANLKYILGTLLTETAGQIAAGFKQWFNVTTPTGTVNDTTTLMARLGAFTGTGVNTVLGFLKALGSKSASTPSDMGGTFSAATDSEEALSEAIATINVDFTPVTDQLDIIQGQTDQLHFTGGAGVEKVNAQVQGVDADAINNAAFADNAITAAKIATDAIGAAQLAASGVSEIQSGLATATSISNLQTHGDATWATGASAPTVPQIVNGVWNELLAGHITPGSVAVAINLINAVYAAVQTIGAGVTYVRSPVSENGDTELRQGVRYTGTHALSYTSDSASDLLASEVTVALNFANRSFPATVTGTPGAWAIRVPITEVETAEIVLGTYQGQLAQYEGGVEVPELSNFNVTMAVNP